MMMLIAWFFIGLVFGGAEERYEHILKSYNLPVKGDINAKREAVREFIGLTPPGK